MPARLPPHPLSSPPHPLIQDHYLTLGKCHVIDSVHTPDEVFIEVQRALDPLLTKQ